MSQIRGLYNFIHDIRNCKTEDEERQRVDEELAKIRKSFSKADESAYNKKKYMWKIMYMYILGYTVDFGHVQCVDLISSDDYSGKNVGYVGVSLLLIEHTDLLRLCIQSIKNDLNSRNELFQCLALTCIANVGGVEFAESLMPDVQQILISQMSRNFVRKKAALCLLRLLRQYPDNLPPSNYAPQVIKLLENRNIGVITSVMSLIAGLATYDPSNYSEIVPVAIRLLSQFVIQRECAKEYVYYRTPCPWLQVKLLRILQYYPPSKDKAVWSKLQEILERVITKTEVTQSVNKNNADHAILFEAINVIIHLNIHGEDMLHDRVIAQLQKFIAVKEGNIRYLGLDAMARLSKIPNTHKLIKKHLKTIQYSLEDSDISIRKRALDLLYGICDEDNVVEIIDNLLRYLGKAEYAMREEMVLKIAILAEKFASDYKWYINVVLQLITIAGDFVTEDVWHRVVQIVTNNEDLQQYAADVVYENLQEPPVHESLVKVAGYILGEFGQVLSVDGKTQFELLHKQFHSSGLDTKALLLSTYMKFANMYSDLAPQIIEIFEQFCTSVDPEIQQRAVEYKVMATYSNQDLISSVWEAMPDFPERESNLIKLVKQKGAERDIFLDENKAAKQENEADAPGHDEQDKRSESGSEHENEGNNKVATPDANLANTAPSKPVEVDLLGDLFGSDMTSGNTNTNNSSGNVQILTQDPSSNHKSMTSLSSLFYEDDNIQIGLKCQVEFGGVMKIIIFYGNKSQMKIGSVLTQMENTGKGPEIEFNPQQFDIPPTEQFKQRCRVLLKQPLIETPKLKITFNIGVQAYSLTAKFPVIASKFFQPHAFEADQFLQRWQKLDKESQKIIKLSDPQWGPDYIKNIMTSGMTVALIAADNNPKNNIGCAMYHFNSKKDDNFITMPILIKIEYNENIKSIRVTCHSPVKQASDSVITACEEIFGA